MLNKNLKISKYFENYKNLSNEININDISKLLIKLKNFKKKIIIFRNGGRANIANTYVYC